MVDIFVSCLFSFHLDIPHWSEWSEWTECSASCTPGGLRFRNATCIGGDSPNPFCIHPYEPSEYEQFHNASEPCNVETNCTGMN